MCDSVIVHPVKLCLATVDALQHGYVETEEVHAWVGGIGQWEWRKSCTGPGGRGRPKESSFSPFKR